MPLNPENTAAKKHKIEATMKAVVSALMNGEAIAFSEAVKEITSSLELLIDKFESDLTEHISLNKTAP